MLLFQVHLLVLSLLCASAPSQEMAGKTANGAKSSEKVPKVLRQSSPQMRPPNVTFADITRKLGISFTHRSSPTNQKYLLETMGSGVALLDYDNDGRLDIFFVNGASISDPTAKGTVPEKTGPEFWNRLYHQKADGRFEDVTERAGVQGRGYGMGVATGDFDNDGLVDLYVTGYGSNQLLRNRGEGRFEDITQKAGVGGSGWSASATFLDYDQDGLLDIFVTRYLDWSFDTNFYCGEKRPGYRAYCHPDLYKGMAPLLYHNRGENKFEEVSRQTGVANPEGKSLGVAIADFDRNGWIDIFVANDSVRQFLYRNKAGKFEDVAVPAGAAVDEDGRTFAGMGVDFADYNNDGLPDVLATVLPNQMYPLFRNEGSESFAYATNESGLGRITLLASGWGTRFLDYDNDGWKDIIVAQSHVLDTVELTQPHLKYKQPLLLARNLGPSGKFQDVSDAAGEPFSIPLAGRGLAIGDLDRDGDLDVVITTNNGSAQILRNDGGNRKNWIAVELTGKLSNRDGIGATVTITTPAGIQAATVTTSSSYLSASEKQVHFGLGTERIVKLLEIRWPSGRVQTLRNVAANQMVRVAERADGRCD